MRKLHVKTPSNIIQTWNVWTWRKKKRILCQLTRSTTAWALPGDLKVHDNINLPKQRQSLLAIEVFQENCLGPKSQAATSRKVYCFKGSNSSTENDQEKNRGSKKSAWIGGPGDRINLGLGGLGILPLLPRSSAYQYLPVDLDFGTPRLSLTSGWSQMGDRSAGVAWTASRGHARLGRLRPGKMN